MKTYLKIKIKSLAAEARMIREEEVKWKNTKQKGEHPLRIALHEHRIHKVRTECRSGNLAYGFLRNRPYASMEAKCYTAPDWDRVQKLIEKYGNGDSRVLLQRFAEWKAEAEVLSSKS